MSRDTSGSSILKEASLGLLLRLPEQISYRRRYLLQLALLHYLDPMRTAALQDP